MPPALFVALAATAGFSWEHFPFFYTDIPARDESACCGSDLVPNPSTNKDGWDCLCDLTDGACDTGCCCDTTDCSYDAYRVGGYFGCTSNGTIEEPTTITTCSSQIVSANIPDQSGVVQAFGGSDGLLCIEYDNSPSRGSYLRDAVAGTALSADQVDRELDERVPIQWAEWLAPESADSSTSTFYTFGDAIQGSGCISASGTDGCGASVDVVVPAVGTDGSCDGQQLLSFLVDVPPFTCNVAAATGTTLASMCTTTLNAQFLQRKQFYTSPIASTAATRTFHISTNVSSTEVASPATTGSEMPIASYDSSTGVCSNALLSYELRLFVGAAGTVDAVDVYVTVGTLLLSDWTSAAPRYGARFEYSDQGTDVRQTSGRPGYQRGLPLLVADGTNLRVDGLRTLPRSTLGICSSGSDGASQVLWREETATTCVTQYTAAELQASCVGVATADALQQDLVASLNLTADNSPAVKIGIYGDSHPDMTSDWVNLNIKYPSTSTPTLVMQWSNEQQECRNMLSAIHLRVLYTQVGLQSSPIDKVVGAELFFETRDVAAARCALDVGDCQTAVAVTATTTFVNLEAESFDYTPNSPTVVPKLPYDFFYPFLVR